MESSEPVQVRVVYALADRQVQVDMALPAGVTAGKAFERSGLAARFPEIPDSPMLAIFGRPVPADEALRSGDRVEILRDLLVDPKENRRQLAARSKAGSHR
jgi:putative ubiquitin-RnfH superfamily antitoxin RatB of RatAB toxin-antitoxin module